MADYGRVGGVWVGTLFNLTGIGTDQNVAVGDRGFDTTNNRALYCLTAAASTSTWGYKTYDYKHSEWAADADTLFYTPWSREVEASTTGGNFVSLVMQHDYEIKGFELVQNSGTPADVTVVGAHIGAAGAEASGSAADTDSIDVTGLDTNFPGSFSGVTGDKGDRISISFDPATSPAAGFLFLTLEIEYTVTAS